MNVEKLNSKQNKSIAIECPNCWGHQEWHGMISDKQQKRTDKSLDGFILRFIKKYIKS